MGPLNGSHRVAVWPGSGMLSGGEAFAMRCDQRQSDSQKQKQKQKRKPENRDEIEFANGTSFSCALHIIWFHPKT